MTDRFTLVLIELQLLISMREQNWTAAGANHICKENTNNQLLIHVFKYVYLAYPKLSVVLQC